MKVVYQHRALYNALYFLFENVVVLVFLSWGPVFHFDPSYLFLAPLIASVCLYQKKEHAVLSFSLRRTGVKLLTAVFWTSVVLMFFYFVFPHAVNLTRPDWVKYTMSPFVVIGLRLGYQSLFKEEKSGIPILVIGSGLAMAAFKEACTKNGAEGYRMCYFNWPSSSSEDAVKRLGSLVLENKIKTIVIATDNHRDHLPVDLLLHFRVQGLEVVEAVSFYEQVFGKIWVESIKPSDLIFSPGFNRETVISWGKRTLDLLAACFGLIVSMPVFFLLPILIKLDSKGSVFYRQERVGEQGRPFMVFKFRSMRQDAEVKTGAVWASENDPRITKLGRIMRKLRLDELPQLINILKGEMSFVGPRPERAVFIEALEKKIPFYNLRHTVKPGLTGLAQVRYRYGASEEDALEKHQYDLYYVKHLSLLFDVSIILSTIRVVLRGAGAR